MDSEPRTIYVRSPLFSSRSSGELDGPVVRRPCFEVNGRKAQALLGALPLIAHLEATEDQAMLRWPIERMMRESKPGASLAAITLLT